MVDVAQLVRASVCGTVSQSNKLATCDIFWRVMT